MVPVRPQFYSAIFISISNPDGHFFGIWLQKIIKSLNWPNGPCPAHTSGSDVRNMKKYFWVLERPATCKLRNKVCLEKIFANQRVVCWLADLRPFLTVLDIRSEF